MKTILVDAVYCYIIEEEGEFKIFQEMHELLESFPNRKILLTGATDDKYKEYGLDKVPYEVFTLKMNPPKSDPEYYRKMLTHFNLNRNDVIHFEHNIDAVKSAESVGIKTYKYDENKCDLIALRHYIEENLP